MQSSSTNLTSIIQMHNLRREVTNADHSGAGAGVCLIERNLGKYLKTKGPEGNSHHVYQKTLGSLTCHPPYSPYS